MNRKLPAILLFALLVLFTISSWLVPEEKSDREHGARSSAENGRRGLVSLLKEFGFDAERWEKRPGALPTRPGMVWLAKLPAGAEVATEEANEAVQDESQGAAPLREALLQGFSNPRHYRRFASQGGTVLVEVSDEKDLARLAKDFGFFEIEHLVLAARTQDAATPDARAACKWISGESLGVSVSEAQALAGLESIPRINVLLEDAARSPLIVEVPIGRGRLVLASCGEIFDNGALALHDHAVVAVRLAERAAERAPIWIDESNGLGGDAPTLLGLALEPRALPFTVSIVLLALFVIWRSLFAREIPRDPPPVEFMSPRTRALARARLFQRARRFDLLADQLRRGIVREIGERSRVPPSLCAQALQSVEGARAFALAIAAATEAEAWTDALVKRPVENGRDLSELDSELRALEARLDSRTHRVPRRRTDRETTLTPSK